MTTLAFVAAPWCGCLVARGVTSGDNRAIGSVIFGGQMLSLLLAPLATPVACSLFDDLQMRWQPRTWVARRRVRPAPAMQGASE
jgi:hypothetical protein